jgi:hypothetical protein
MEKEKMSKHMVPKTLRRPLTITWDNPVPADSSRLIRQLKRHGSVRKIEPKTTVALTPHGHTDWRRIRRTIESNLHPSRGRASYTESEFTKGVRIRTQYKLQMEEGRLRQTAEGEGPGN